MNTEELKHRFAKHLIDNELNGSDGYAVEWTVAAIEGKGGESWVSKTIACPKCHGYGLVNEPNKPEKHDCAYCEGTGYIPAIQPDKSNEAGERKFTLDEMRAAFTNCYNTGKVHPGNSRNKDEQQYFIKTFNIDLGERK